MRKLFNSEHPLWLIFGFVGDIVVLSLLWTVCSAPILTLGAASAALYDAVVADFRWRLKNNCIKPIWAETAPLWATA